MVANIAPLEELSATHVDERQHRELDTPTQRRGALPKLCVTATGLASEQGGKAQRDLGGDCLTSVLAK